MIAKAQKIWMDGKIMDWDDAQVHVLSHTLHYGLGVFEGIRCYQSDNGRAAIFRLTEHVDRLFASAHIVEIQIPYSKEEIAEAIKETVRVNNLKAAYIRPLVFIGDGEMGLYVDHYNVRAAIAAWPWGAYLGEEGLKKGIRAQTSSFIRHHVNASMTKAKICGNYVNSILAKKEAKKSGYDEAIILDAEGYVAEASGENIFMVSNGILKTTSLTSILPGITRDTVISIAKGEQIEVREERFSRDELYIAQEAFLTGTAAEITPIRELDNRVIGEGKPGSITCLIQSAFFNVVYGRDERYIHWLCYL